MIIGELDSKDYTLDDIVNAQTLLSKGELPTFCTPKEFEEMTQFLKR